MLLRTELGQRFAHHFFDLRYHHTFQNTMKVQHLLLSLFLILGSAFAEEAEVNAQGEMVQNQVNCDEVCAAKVAEAVGNAVREKEGIMAELNTAREEAQRASAEANESNSRLNDALAEIETLKQKVASSEKALEESKNVAQQAKSAAEKATAAESSKVKAAEAKVRELEKEAAAAKKEAAEYSSSRFFINLKLIQKDFEDLLKSYGLMK